jgi:hypothetical protein
VCVCMSVCVHTGVAHAPAPPLIPSLSCRRGFSGNICCTCSLAPLRESEREREALACLEHGQVDPEIVGVKVLVACNVLKAALVGVRAHCRLAQHQLAVGDASRKVTSLLISWATLAHLHSHRGSYINDTQWGHT